jgi:ubiquinol-cytochrome c reductase cytochrome b subunit
MTNPLSKLRAFLDDRLGLPELRHQFLTGKTLPKGTSWLHTLGYAALTLFLLQMLTGIALAFHYSPSTQNAYDSIRVFEQSIPYGALTRGLHHYGASAMLILLFLHALRVFFAGAYKKPRELTWLLGLGLFGCVIGLGFTGYLLPWDQKAYFATKVGVNMAAQAPIGGPEIQQALYGGPDIGPNTLGRFFVLHILILPLALIALLVLHLFQVQRHGITPKGLPVGQKGEPGPPYHPNHSLKEALVALLTVAVVAYLALQHGAPLEAEADPADLAYDPRPEWYFLGLFQLLKFFPGSLESIGAFWLPNLFLACLAFLPFFDRNPERKLKKRPLALSLGILFLVSIISLTWLGAQDRPKHYRTPPHPLGASPEIKRGYLLVRREGCFSCHTYTDDQGQVFGETKEEDDAPDMADFEASPEEMLEFLADPESDIMPNFDHLKVKERLAIGKYLKNIRAK